MSAAVLAIGTEITRGEIVNTNANWLADALVEVGLEVTAMEAIPDDAALIVETLRRLSERHRVIMCTGGLGPTTDDITSECVAKLLGVPLQRDAESLEAIRARMASFGRSMATSNEKQADFPEGATVIANRKGTAPGFAIDIAAARAFFMPGVPREMKTMFREAVMPELAAQVSERIVQIRLKTFGMPESAVNDRLAGIESVHGVVLAYRAHFPEIEVKVMARDAHAEIAAARARKAADVVRERLGDDVVYGEGDVTFAQALGELLVARQMRIGTAESCTGGMIGEVLTERGGASDFYVGGIVSYANAVKTRQLAVSEALLEARGAVSAEVARAMAQGALSALDVDVAVATTGIAGPSGGSADKPVGLVHFAVATRDGVSDRQMRFPGSREQVRRLASFAALALVRSVLRHGHRD
ncbi:MAG: competence/damage-inducible protein A [Polyangiaceae bacterium]